MSELYKAANDLLNSIHCDEEIDREKALRCGDCAVWAAARIARLEEALRKLSTVRHHGCPVDCGICRIIQGALGSVTQKRAARVGTE